MSKVSSHQGTWNCSYVVVLKEDTVSDILVKNPSPGILEGSREWKWFLYIYFCDRT